ncbi:hypothetical protein D9619_010300 [Psilocybe cf. subviscida]|uniref:Peptidase A1 domain-containing protein n=1 Tax=Psilocybe cf. subviscida TaxID=2480587 RepID=A0A8H5ERK4_9AGAR|nr:hypothetical protein D9619_010300 [Psilocybe cf. subviscida]
MHIHFFYLVATALGITSTLAIEPELSLDGIARRYTKRTPGGLHLPLLRQEPTSGNALARRQSAVAGAVGLGDYADVAYLVLTAIGSVTVPFVLDTGSSDLWVESDACTEGCTTGDRVYPQASFQYANIDVKMQYGDSATGTFASGKVGDDTVTLAGLGLQDQYFAAINRTNTSVTDVGAAGIFGLGFPINSVIWNEVFVAQYGADPSPAGRRDVEGSKSGVVDVRPNVKFGSPFPHAGTFFRRTPFPQLPGLLGERVSRFTARDQSSILAEAFASYKTFGPFISRLVALDRLALPMFSVTLQRDTIDVGGNLGVLSLGELPGGVQSENFTWVPLRAYSPDEGGLPAPSDSPDEQYPITWEVFLDAVYFDGQKLPESKLADSSIKLSTLVDTGNSLIRGPKDVVQEILRRIPGITRDGVFACAEPHTLTFEIGGRMFDVDPRDFISQAYQNNVDDCIANLVSTDPPHVGGYQFSWSLGIPFLKGVVSTYYYGNLTHPSRDQPKMGFFSTVPRDAGELLKKAVGAAAAADRNFPAISETAPAGTIAPTGSGGLAQATRTGTSSVDINGAAPGFSIPGLGVWSCTALTIALSAGVFCGL